MFLVYKPLQHSCWSGAVTLDGETGGGVPLFRKEAQRMCSKFQGIILLSLPGIICARVSERSVRPSVVVIKSNGCGPALDLT